jgi:tRNA U34 2-thiouridine synthase MnmA/TrmU
MSMRAVYGDTPPWPDSVPPLAVGLMSGGLDSILAAVIVRSLGFRVVAFRFITPFFGWELRGREEELVQSCRERYDIDLRVTSVWPEYLEIVRRPEHGFGKNMNPCIDCKIFMLRKARAQMEEMGAAFVFTGEVLGQRPMSQRRDTLHLIENASGLKDRLLRPLSAHLLPPSLPERDGRVDRAALFAIRGRGRADQIAMAARLGITDYPAPAGGCLLADPTFAARVKSLKSHRGDLDPGHVELLTTGRHFILPGGGHLVVGRNQRENERMLRMAAAEDTILSTPDVPGPVVILRDGAGGDRAIAAAITARYADGTSPLVRVAMGQPGNTPTFEESRALPAGEIEAYRL